jgi:drug/metabolite transporter (DMT)-like permease
MEQQRQAYLYAITAVCLWATVGSAFKISLQYIDFLQLLFYAALVSVVFLFIVLLLQGKIALLRTYSRSDYLRSMMLGFLNPFLYYLVLIKAYALLPAQEAVALNYIWPLMIVLLSIPLLKQKIGFRRVLAILISFFGVLVISTRGDLSALHFSNPAGDFLALGSALIWALFWIGNVRDPRDETAKLFLNFLFGFIFILIAAACFSGLTIPAKPGLFGALYLGLFEMGLTFIVWLKALQKSRTTAQVSNFIYVVPFLSLVIISIAVGEKILPSTVTGCVFIIAGILLQQIGGRVENGIAENRP